MCTLCRVSVFSFSLACVGFYIDGFSNVRQYGTKPIFLEGPKSCDV